LVNLLFPKAGEFGEFAGFVFAGLANERGVWLQCGAVCGGKLPGVAQWAPSVASLEAGGGGRGGHSGGHERTQGVMPLAPMPSGLRLFLGWFVSLDERAWNPPPRNERTT
jgi:hypothetical protein